MTWRALNRGGDIRIAFITRGPVIHPVSETKYGTLAAAREAARALNDKRKEGQR